MSRLTSLTERLGHLMDQDSEFTVTTKAYDAAVALITTIEESPWDYYLYSNAAGGLQFEWMTETHFNALEISRKGKLDFYQVDLIKRPEYLGVK